MSDPINKSKVPDAFYAILVTITGMTWDVSLIAAALDSTAAANLGEEIAAGINSYKNNN